MTIDRSDGCNDLAVAASMLAPTVLTTLRTHAEECLSQPFLDIVQGTPIRSSR
ncbi:MAG: hypothetical protein ACRCY8_10460 [Dermatophilaceae bacterium]